MRQLILLLTSLLFINTEAQLRWDFEIQTGFGTRPFVLQKNGIQSQEVSIIRNAISSDKIDYNAIINVLAASDDNARERMRKGAFNDLRNKLTGDFEKAVSILLSTPTYYFAHEIYSALFGFGADESALIDILCLLNNRQLLHDIKNTYTQFYQRYLESDIRENIAGNFQNLLLKCAANSRTEDSIIFYTTGIERDTKRILDNSRLTHNNNELITMLGAYDFKRIKDIVNKCDQVTGETEFLKNLIMQYPNDDFQIAAFKILTFAESPEAYYAARFESDLVESDLDHRSISRLIIMEKNVDMKSVAKIYQKNFGKNLENAIDSHIHDEHYKQLLLAILRPQISEPYHRRPIL